VVGTLMSNLGLELALKTLNVGFERATVGDRYVFEKLQAKGWQLGGESSGHLLVLDRHSTGDGIVSALQVLRAVRNLGMPLADILKPVAMLPQVLKNARLPVGYDWANDVKVQGVCEAVKAELGSQGRLLIRPSGTEPVLRVMVETADRHIADRLVDQILDALPSVSSQ
ncbi:MAG: phosphoglucosamine mutase, partial [Limnobacter sp.]